MRSVAQDRLGRTRRSDGVCMTMHKLPSSVDEFVQAGHAHMKLRECFAAANPGAIIFHFHNARHPVVGVLRY